jgi:hypothetical protein
LTKENLKITQNDVISKFDQALAAVDDSNKVLDRNNKTLQKDLEKILVSKKSLETEVETLKEELQKCEEKNREISLIKNEVSSRLDLLIPRNETLQFEVTNIFVNIITILRTTNWKNHLKKYKKKNQHV